MKLNRRQFLTTATVAAVAATSYDYDMAVAAAEARYEAEGRARALEDQGWEAWYTAIFGAAFVADLGAHHREAIEWHWNAVTAILEGKRPDFTAYFSPWSRSHMKSTIARRIAVCSAARRGRGYCLYVGGTKDKVQGHALSIKALLESPKLRHYYPLLGQVSETERGNSKGDQRNFTFTKHGYVFHFVSLDSGVAGANVEDVRPTEIFMDDVDDRNDSHDVAERRLNTLTTSVLPTKQHDTLFFFAQNLIHDFSIATRILRNEVRVLVNRKPTKPIPAIRNLKTELRTELIDGVEVMRDVVLSGDPTWHKYGLDRAQQDIDDVGLVAFLKEYQHEVNKDRLGLVLPEYDERVHVITWSQFEAVYGTREIPSDWAKSVGHDWGNTHPCVVSATAVASVRSKRPGLHFLFAGIEAPTNSAEDHVAELIINRFFPWRETAPGRWEGVNTELLHNLDPTDIARWQTGRLGELHNAPRELAQQTVAKRVGEALNKDRSWQVWNMSHEQKQRCEVYNRVYGLPFKQINPGAAGGIDELRRLMRVDYKQPHPFKPGVMGYSQFFLIVADDQYYEEGVGGLVSKAKDDKGLSLWRYQIPRYRWQELKIVESGVRSDVKPLKIHDDTANSLMMVYVEMALGPGNYNKDEQVEIMLPDNYRADKISETIQQGGAGAWHALQDTKHEIRQELESKTGTGRKAKTGRRPILTLGQRGKNRKR